MQKPTWGYKIVNKNSFNFQHELLPFINLKYLASTLSSFDEISVESDKSITVTVDEFSLVEILRQTQNIFESLEKSFTDTSNFSYKVTDKTKKFLNEYFLALEACIGLILIKKNPDFFNSNKFHLIDSRIGGLFISPFTILLYEDYAKVVHPIKISNFEIRSKIEKSISTVMKGVFDRVEEAQVGQEGLALLSYTEYKTGLSSEEIVNVINTKVRNVRTPKNSPLLTN